MTDEIETLNVGVRAELGGFARDVAAMKGSLEGTLGGSADRTGRLIETSLLRAVRTGKTGFEDMGRAALSILASIAGATLSGGGGIGLGGGLLSVAGSILGLPGRATGGPVSPGRAFLVGERGPEVFVPTSSGSVAPLGGGGGRDVRVAIQINAPQGETSRLLARSARQVARAVRSALE